MRSASCDRWRSFALASSSSDFRNGEFFLEDRSGIDPSLEGEVLICNSDFFSSMLLLLSYEGASRDSSLSSDVVVATPIRCSGSSVFSWYAATAADQDVDISSGSLPRPVPLPTGDTIADSSLSFVVISQCFIDFDWIELA